MLHDTYTAKQNEPFKQSNESVTVLNNIRVFCPISAAFQCCPRGRMRCYDRGKVSRRQQGACQTRAVRQVRRVGGGEDETSAAIGWHLHAVFVSVNTPGLLLISAV